MTFPTRYPYPCPDCATPITDESQRYRTYRRCRPCGLASGRERQRRVKARKKGLDVPLRKFGPPTLTYPFPCARCDQSVASPEERGDNWSMCKPCLRETRREMRAQQRYGLTAEEFRDMYAASGDACAICSRHPGPKGLVIDHDHATGVVRGLLCWPCNWMLGHVEGDATRLRSAADYLDSFSPR